MENRSAIRQPNCLNTVRLLAALSIIVGHGVQHLQIWLPPWCIWLVSYFRGVPIFFVLSGFLIWESLSRNDLKQYAKKRFLRIYPELWAAVVLGLAVLLVLYHQPVSWLQLGAFAVCQGSFLQFWTPDCLRGYGCGTPNGALWTIGLQIQFYVAAWFVYKRLGNQKWWHWLAVVLTAVLVSALLPMSASLLPEIGYKLLGQTLLPYGWLFLLGCLLAKYSREVLPWLKQLWPVLLLAAAVVKLLGTDVSAGYDLLHSIFLAIGLIGFAYGMPRTNIPVDISYGMYIYHMIVINAMIALGFTGSWMHLAVAILITCMLAAVSAWTIGSLRRKNKTKAGESI